VWGNSAEVELFEKRIFLSANPLAAQVAETTVQLEKPAATTAAGNGYTPAQLQAAYGFNKISFASGANGTGETIAIVDAYNYPTVQADLKAFDAACTSRLPPVIKA
jgi:subtilase family serine protease